MKKDELINHILKWSEKTIELVEKDLDKVMPFIPKTSDNIKKGLTKMTKQLAPELQKGLYDKQKVVDGAKEQFEKKFGKIADPINKPDKYIGKRKGKQTERAKASEAQKAPPKAQKKPPKRIRKPTAKAQALKDAKKNKK